MRSPVAACDSGGYTREVQKRDPLQLPIHPRQNGDQGDDAAPACSPKIYVSDEEAALLREIHLLRQRAFEVRSELGAAPPARRRELERRLDELRAQRKLLEKRRERAFRRKMVMLGHLPERMLEDDGLEPPVAER